MKIDRCAVCSRPLTQTEVSMGYNTCSARLCVQADPRVAGICASVTNPSKHGFLRVEAVYGLSYCRRSIID